MKVKKNLIVCSVIITLLTAFSLPYNYSDGFKFMFGYPVSFFTTYNLKQPIQKYETLLMRTSTDLLGFFVDAMLIYCILYLLQMLRCKIKNGRDKMQA